MSLDYTKAAKILNYNPSFNKITKEMLFKIYNFLKMISLVIVGEMKSITFKEPLIL